MLTGFFTGKSATVHILHEIQISDDIGIRNAINKFYLNDWEGSVTNSGGR
ncbi:hypothetical protein AGR6A_pa20015 [Agrobacterium sp. NCPPB 925]|nr:hypothetical protein AGR6A_pa20015 [Agrobacterium sp. NCPPB 925]